jgi:hypothetical protein
LDLIRVQKYLMAVCAALVVLLPCLNVAAQEAPASNHAGSLSELLDKRRALLVVFKSRVVDVNGDDRAIIDDVLKGDRSPRGRYAWVYNDLAVRLNKYINKHGSMLPARNLSDAEYVIFFNVVEFRRILNALYAYGELFVIVKGTPKDLKPPRIVWRAKKVLISTDAIRDLIKDLKTFRGES